MAGDDDDPGLGQQIGKLEHVGDLLADARPVAIERHGQRQLVEPRRSPPPVARARPESTRIPTTHSISKTRPNRQTEPKQPVEEDQDRGRRRHDDRRVGRQLEEELPVQSPAQASELGAQRALFVAKSIESRQFHHGRHAYRPRE